MLHKTRGIVVSYMPYRESSVIVTVYTELFGIQSYIENSVRSPKAKNKAALFQPLTLLDLVVYFRPQGGLTRLSEIRCHTPLRTLPYNFYKASVGMFITEVLRKTLKEEEANQSLFDFLFDSIIFLDEATADFENFHLHFLLKLSQYLGFAPESATEIFTQLNANLLHSRVLAPPEDFPFLDQLLQTDYSDPIKVSHLLRRDALEHLLAFYQLHVENFGETKSLSVLKEIMG